MTDAEFFTAIDRDLRDCICYAAILGFHDPHDVGGAMFELSPVEVLAWHWERDLAAYAP